jgi:iron complex transport system substrate-binding protein
VLEQLRDAGVTLVVVPDEDSIEGAKTKIATIGELFGASERAADLNRQIDLDVLEARLYLDAVRAQGKPRVMFVYARGAGTLSVSGTNTSAHAMIALAGGENAVTDYEGYKPLTAEAAVAAAPEVLLFLTRGLESVGGVEGLRELPGLALTPAYEAGRVVAFDDLHLLGFGPRVGQAVLELTQALYPELRFVRP